ncbi:MAG: hypothetical protein WDN75_14760 [Bacteroidota bacterium]
MQFLASSIDIPASDKKDLFHIETAPGGNARITLQKIKKDDTPGDTTYDRTIDREVTKEIRLYGRGGEDIFIVDGKFKPGFKIRMIGGGALDSFYVSKTTGSHKLMIYDRSDKKNKYPRHGARLLTSEKQRCQPV